LTGLNIASTNVREAYTYEATPWALLPKIIRRMRICVQPYSFVDYGSGKGRQVLSAARFPFREVIGVEFSPELCEIAEHNLHECRWLPRRAGRIRIVCSDALDFELPAGPSLLFFFRPFSTKLMREVLTEVHRAWLEENRKIYLLLCGFLSKDMEDIRSLSFLSEVQRGVIRCDLFYKVPVHLVEMGNQHRLPPTGRDSG
jgi:hypothetical protein